MYLMNNVNFLFLIFITFILRDYSSDYYYKYVINNDSSDIWSLIVLLLFILRPEIPKELFNRRVTGKRRKRREEYCWSNPSIQACTDSSPLTILYRVGPILPRVSISFYNNNIKDNKIKEIETKKEIERIPVPNRRFLI